MLIKCSKCQSQFDISQPGTFKCAVCSNIFTLKPEDFAPKTAMPMQPLAAQTVAPQTAAAAPVQAPVPAPAPMLSAETATNNQTNKKPLYKIIGIALALLLVIALGFGGYYLYNSFFNQSALDYVQEDAEFVVYGNTQLLFDSKVWHLLEDERNFRDEVLREVKNTLSINDVEDLEGNFAVWGYVPNGPFRGTIILKKGNAEKIFNTIRNTAEEKSEKCETKKLDNCRMLVVYESDYRHSYRRGNYPEYKVLFSMVQVNDNILQLSFKEEQHKIFEPESSSPIASAIDRSAVLASAVSPGWWDKLDEEVHKENVDIPLRKLGIAVLEVFCTRKELEIRARLDISKLDK